MSLTGDAGEDESLGKRRLKLALLAMLAVSRRPFPREVLVDTFWGDQGEEHARHSLSDALSHLRRVLGREAIATRAADIALSPRADLAVDALELAAAADAGDHLRVVELYAGPFLDGVHVERSTRFEHWVSHERERLEQLFLTSAPEACRISADRGDVERWQRTAERWVEVSPTSAEAVRHWLAALAAPGTRAALEAAITAFEHWAARLKREFDLEPEPDLAAEAASYRAALAEAPGAMLAGRRGAAPTRPIRAGWLAAAAAGALLLGAGYLLSGHRSAPAAAARPVVAVLPLRNLRHDTATAWLGDGIQRMLIADLSRAGAAPGGPTALDVVDPSLLHDAERSRGLENESAPTTAQAVALGRGLGATWVVTGGVTTGQGAYVVDITVRRTSDAAPIQVYSVVGKDILTVADRAAAQILSALDTQARGPRLADVETGNVEAYQHFVRAVQASQEGRPDDEVRELNAAIALDSGFVSAILWRLRFASLVGDVTTERRLAPLLARAGSRVTRWDRLELDANAAEHDGEHRRAEELGRKLVADYPRDPRGYGSLAGILADHGKWAAADSVLERLLALDPLATAAGTGPCVPCAAYDGLVSLRVTTGDLAGAERAAQRWIALQPDIPGPWRDLGVVLSFGGRFGPALKATERAVALSNGDAEYTLRIGGVLLMARDYRGADSLIRLWQGARNRGLREGALDLEAMGQRERGEYRASNATFERLIALDSGDANMRLVEANSLARLGQRQAAVALYERIERGQRSADSEALGWNSALQPLTGDVARTFTWNHALEADAAGGWWPGAPPPQVDTIWLGVLADSMREIGARSYYGRDWRLPHHVRGLIAMAGGRWAEAVRDFQAARWGAAGWTATDAMLAQAYLALGRTDSALAVLRAAYEGPLDAVGRYVPRTSLDFLMAVAFARAGQRDSARVYAGYVRRAWAHADPELRVRLAALPR